MGHDLLLALLSHGYLYLYFAVTFFGNTVTTLAGVAVSLGHFAFFWVYFIATTANMVADIVFFLIGRRVKRSGSSFGLSEKQPWWYKIGRNSIFIVRKLFRENEVKALIATKFLPFMAWPGNIIAGVEMRSWKKFVFVSLAIALIRNLLGISLGYSLGEMVSSLFVYYQMAGIIFGSMAVLSIFFLYNKAMKEFMKKFF